jgi:hypothetical protein
MNINVALAYRGGTALIVFNENCYWEIPASEQFAEAIAEGANSIAGEDIDSIVISDDCIAIKTTEAEKCTN